MIAPPPPNLLCSREGRLRGRAHTPPRGQDHNATRLRTVAIPVESNSHVKLHENLFHSKNNWNSKRKIEMHPEPASQSAGNVGPWLLVLVCVLFILRDFWVQNPLTFLPFHSNPDRMPLVFGYLLVEWGVFHTNWNWILNTKSALKLLFVEMKFIKIFSLNY